MQVPIQTKQPEEIPEVAEFQQSKEMLQAFRDANPEFFQHYDALVDDYNQKREAAEKAVRAEGVKCGDFDAYQSFKKYDWKKLLTSVGRDRFLEIGGWVKNKKEAGGDSKALEIAITKGLVSQELVDDCATVETRWHVPPAVVVAV